MKPYRRQVDIPAVRAARAMSDLNIFYAIIALTENGLLHSESDADAQRIRKICLSASGKRLKEYDRAIRSSQ